MSGAQLFLFAIFTWLGLLVSTVPSLADKRIALVIGNSHYRNTPTLENPINDATDVAQALSSLGFEVTLKLDQTKRETDQAIEQLYRSSEGADAVLFYYSGHGMQYDGRNYIVPIDAALQDEISLRYELSPLDDVKAALQHSTGVKIIVLDACRTNPLANRFARSISSTTRDIPKVQGYARAEQVQGTVIVYATQANEVANDGLGRNSPFSKAFLKELKEPGLEIGTMLRRVGADVYKDTFGHQLPEISISLLSEYYLNQSETDRTVWARIRASGDAATLREFITRYPKSFFAQDAAARLELLEQKSDAQPSPNHSNERQNAERLEPSDKNHSIDLASAQPDVASANGAPEESSPTIGRSNDQGAAKTTHSPVVLPPITPDSAFVPQIRDELRRLGCYSGPDADWETGQMRLGLTKFAIYAKLPAAPKQPSLSLLEDLKSRQNRLCPPGCSAHEVNVGGRCIVKTCGHDELLSRAGMCIPRAVRRHQLASSASAPLHPIAKGRCFVFNGNQYCE